MIQHCDYIFTSSVVLRTPAYACDQYRKWKELENAVRDEFFQAAIFTASKSLYRELSEAGFELANLKDKARFTLRKYLNRMCYRPTPFGLFSGISVVPWGKDEQVIRDDQYQLHTFYSFSDASDRAEEIIHGHLKDEISYRANNSIYKLKSEFRFLRYQYNREAGKRVFFIQHLDRSKAFDSLFAYLKKARSKKRVVDFLHTRFEIPLSICEVYFGQLIGEQIIMPVLQPSVIGEDYLERVKRLSNFPTQNDRTAFEDIIDRNNNGANNLYVNMEHTGLSGSVNLKHQEQIKNALAALDVLMPYQQPKGLETFVDQFKSKFDRQRIPLMEALDPEVGVGYEVFAGSPNSSVLLKDIKLEQERSEHHQEITWTSVHTFLLGQWNNMLNGGGPKVITLTANGLKGLSAATGHHYPPSISVLFRVIAGNVYIEKAGGATATALAGRFTLFNDEVFEEARCLATIEEQSNPDVIFAEINHICEDHTANIDRRKHIRRFEIPILAGSSLDRENQVQLSDLWVSVSGDQIILWSEKLQKVVIPRLSSAFNFNRSELAVFRFLCDLQYQGLKSNFNFDLSNFFPGQFFYPRVQFENTIIQLAGWNLAHHQLEALNGLKTQEEKLDCLKKWVVQYAWPSHISMDEHDNQLIFDTSDDASLLFLADNLKNCNAANIKEYPFNQKEDQAVVSKENGCYAHQMVASLFHKNTCYNSLSDYQSHHPSGGMVIKRKFIPGSEWLYVKIYCHPSRANEILLALASCLSSKLPKMKVNKWFFVRYRDPAYHIRARLYIAVAELDSCVSFLKKRFAAQVESGMISDLQFGTYEREVERYTSFLMENVEQLFSDSTVLILSFIKHVGGDQSNIDYYLIAFLSISKMADVFGFTLENKIAIFKALHESMLAEFNVTAGLNDQIKLKYRNIKRYIQVLDGHAFDAVGEIKESFENFESSCSRISSAISQWPENERIRIFSDLIHMHLNRLMVDDARKQELLIYYCAWKNYLSQKGRQHAKKNSV